MQMQVSYRICNTHLMCSTACFAESLVVNMRIAVFIPKGGRRVFFMISEKFYKYIFLAVSKLLGNLLNAHIGSG